MSTKPYVIRLRDNSEQLEQWTFAGLSYSGANNDGGVLYAKIASASGTATIGVYKDDGLASGDLVAQGTNADTGEDVEVSLSAQNASGLTGTVRLRDYVADDSDMILWPTLAIDTHLNAREDNLSRWRLSGDSDLADFHQRTLRDFYRKMMKRLTPQIATYSRAVYAAHPFALNKAGEWEVSRLRNVEMFREWAIVQTLAHLYKTNGVAVGEGVYAMGLEMQKEADLIWEDLVPIMDTDSDGQPEEHIASTRFYRG